MAYTSAIVNMPGRIAGVYRAAGTVIDVSGLNPKTLKLMIQEGRVTPVAANEVPAAVSSAELAFLDGVTSNVQTQLNGKAAAADLAAKADAADVIDVTAFKALVAGAADYAAFQTAVAAL